MSAEEHKAIAKRFWEEVYGQGKFEIADEVLTSGYKLRQPKSIGGDKIWTDKEQASLETMVKKFREQYSDLRVEIEEQVAAEGDRVVTRYNLTGTHNESNNKMTVAGISLDLVSGNKLKESWVSWDVVGLLEQEGLVPQPRIEDPSERWRWCWFC